MDNGLISPLFIGSLIVFGAALYAAIIPLLKKGVEKFRERAPLVKKYWKFVIPLLIITTIAYIVVYIFLRDEIHIAIVGQISGLVLAVFAGYIAFTELGETRFDNLEEAGMREFSQKRPVLALDRLKEAHSIRPGEMRLLGNLMEVYLVLGYFDEFDAKATRYRRQAKDEGHKLTLHYLLCLKELIREHLKEAKIQIKATVKYAVDNPNSREGMNGWRNDSDLYSNLSPESKKHIDNLLNYVTKKMSAEHEKQFIEGDFTLSKS